MSGAAPDPLDRLAERGEDEPGYGYITMTPDERDALVEIARAARHLADLEYGYEVGVPAWEALVAALARLAATEASEV